VSREPALAPHSRPYLAKAEQPDQRTLVGLFRFRALATGIPQEERPAAPHGKGAREETQVAAGLRLEVRVEQGTFVLEAALEASAGETLVLVGPSGSGKSTCLRAVAGLAQPEEGRIELGGRAVFDSASGIDLPPWKRRVGMVFQDFALFPHMSVERNVLYGLRGVRDARERCAAWLAALGLAELAGRRPRGLSGGQQQRVALARAAARESDVLLLDEPFGSLDAATRRTVRGELRRYLRIAAAGELAPRRPVVMVTHDYLDALTLGDRIAVLEAGRVTQVGTREEVLRRPRTPFLAELTGHNVLEGRLGPREADADLRPVEVGPVVVHAAGAGDLAEGPVFVSFGPQEVTLLRGSAGAPESSARNRFRGVVREVAPLADRMRVYLDVGVPLMADVVRSAAEELGLAEGAEVIAVVKATAVEVYA
jgi:molybdate transport system ATP-binding protein